MQDSSALIKLLSRFTIDQSGAIWIGLLLLIFVAANTKNLKSRLNFSLLLLMFPAIPLMDSLVWVNRVESGGYTYTQGKLLIEIAFASLYAVTATMAIWAFAMSRGKNVLEWKPNLSLDSLKVVFVVVLIMNMVVLFGRPADDAGIYTNLGAKRWLETGTLPYGDPLLKGPDSPAHGAAATYGPLLYLSHIPFQFLTGVSLNPAEMNPRDPAYHLPPMLATQLTCLFFYLLGLWALFGIGKKLGGTTLGYSLITLFAGCSYIFGLGSGQNPEPALAGGLGYISHIAPTAMLLLAVYYLDRPLVSGMFVAGAAGVLFFPVFFFPFFLGWYFWKNRKSAIQFTAGFAIAGALIGLMVIIFTGTLDGKGPIKLLLESTLEHQEGFSSDQYGLSPFSFWGNFPTLASFWQKPLVGGSSIMKPTFILFISYCIACFFLVRKRTLAEFALMLASLAAAIQLWKTHAAGTYVEWYYPFLLIGLLGRSSHWKQELEKEKSATG